MDLNSAKIAVTGATGMLGSHIVAQLLHMKCRDIVLPIRDRNSIRKLCSTLHREGFVEIARQLETNTPPFHIVEVSLNDPHGLNAAFAGVDVVFHCAAMVSLSNTKPKEIIEANVEMTTHIVNAALKNGVSRFIHTSSIAALGTNGTNMIDESCSLETLDGTSPYGVSKFLSENRVWRAHQEGLNVIVVNPSVILGAGEWHDGGSAAIIPMISGGFPFYTTGVVGYVDVRDVAKAETALAQCDNAVGHKFILSSENLSYKELISLGAKFAEKRKPLINIDALLPVAWRINWVMSKIFGYENKLTAAVARSARNKCRYDGSKVIKYVDFKYTPIAQTIERLTGEYLK